MALLLSETNALAISSGCRYWRIADYRMYDLMKQGDIFFFGYKDKETYDALEDKTNKFTPKVKSPISIPDYDTYFSRQALVGNDIFEVMYDYSKINVVDFNDATDI